MHASFDTFVCVWAEVGPLVDPHEVNDARDCLFDIVLQFRDIADHAELQNRVLTYFKRKWQLA